MFLRKKLQEERKTSTRGYSLIKHQILRTIIIRNIQGMVERIKIQISGTKWLNAMITIGTSILQRQLGQVVRKLNGGSWGNVSYSAAHQIQSRLFPVPLLSCALQFHTQLVCLRSVGIFNQFFILYRVYGGKKTSIYHDCSFNSHL